MNVTDLLPLLEHTMQRLQDARDELRGLDAAIGDGDLGITVADGAAAARTVLSDTPPDTPADLLKVVGRAFAKANPSTFSGLVAAVLLAASKQWGDRTDVNRTASQTLLDTAVTTLAARGGAELGDKTLLDAVAASAEALRHAGPDAADALAIMIQAVDHAVEETTPLRSQRGRAAWVGDRSIGHRDGGMVAYLRFVQALSESWAVTS